MHNKERSIHILPRSFYQHDTPEVARQLLGKLLVRLYDEKILIGRIVEVEAYRNDDAASHSYRGKTERNSAMFGPVGCAYVYFTYGMHYCLNLVAHNNKYVAGGVLIRAVEPLDGIEVMQLLRKNSSLKNLTNGPGKVAQAFGIARQLNHHDVTHFGELMVYDAPSIEDALIGVSGRIGIRHAQETPWRFFIKGNAWISR